MFSPRCSGILLHITSLPSPYGVGDLGPAAQRFADFLRSAGQRLWQVLPLAPVSAVNGYSPYTSTSAFAGSSLVISPRRMVEDGLLDAGDLDGAPAFPPGRASFPEAESYRDRLFEIAWRRFSAAGSSLRDGAGKGADFERFCRDNAAWLDDYALFEAIRHKQSLRSWADWPIALRKRRPAALAAFARSAGERIGKIKMVQWIFASQWRALRDYCRRLGIHLIGDMPFYISHDSADVWAHRECFQLDRRGRPTRVAGTPPDFFSKTGQLWGNPVYDWELMRKDGFSWWLDRMDRNYQLYDFVRIDHFLGLLASWQVRAGQPTAARGRWVGAPGREVLRAMMRRRPAAAVLAEDLGSVTADVRETMREFEIPGMRPLLFAFGEHMPHSIYAPHRHGPNNIAYTGTHDNNTVRGWFQTEASKADKRRFFTYVGREVAPDQAAWEMIRLAMMSVAAAAIVPMQDVLNLGAESRMNCPAQPGPHWTWRMTQEQASDDLAKRLAEMTKTYGRE